MYSPAATEDLAVMDVISRVSVVMVTEPVSKLLRLRFVTLPEPVDVNLTVPSVAL